ncbi:MAG: UDP-N-acetylmuramoyl-L-alanyl-D-glutamate--2,6-diaminopimelate ligase [Dethiobacteria bacterium]|nr:UDP-N-acetylmuramoyl-L-alanyl-D-glutamate--2,6-diaminopimelate ligase [Bacillota bacterium]HOA34676.1 UDP-N-acetylmuramoyl-L-alanyl-D-glutamate--2,6-diaminopimelate ligase [Bacillota bacterium]HOJ83224.1 UDP-N-acetylmuramoyl-L-alanyl-D-glutamate--2,6-diaminopimelate ligase [Bacillota bacterium]HOL14978.1 UDP-N-acetylmuramoyl-L-alanyl-D-glutamate--2,6-diaminopimelate ligase [Bacillota bacterium]
MKEGGPNTEDRPAGQSLNAWILLQPFAGRELKKRLEAIRVSRLAHHSAEVKPGTLFFCLPGKRTDGHDHVAEAVNRGAAALVVSRPVGLERNKVPVITVDDTALALSAAAASFYGFPSLKMKTIGVTGTNGKTTTTYFVKNIFKAAGWKTAILGSNGLIIDGIRQKFNLTTPQSLDLQERLHFSLEQGALAAVMEVSSHALVQRRTAHCFFDSVVYTNLTREHLDYHHSMAEYLKAKSMLMDLLKERSGGKVILNADDFYYSELALRAAKRPRLTYGIREKAAEVRAVNITERERGRCSFDLLGWSKPYRVLLQLPGEYNLYNALAAAAVARSEGLPLEAVTAGLNGLRQVPGRFEEMETPAGFTVIIDFAHTPDGLEQVLKLLSTWPARRRITLFGCPGERDRGKRPLMGRIAELYSDEVILTADNPAGEDALAIIDDIKEGMRRAPQIIPDRREAVYYALSRARPGDMVLLAGKGDEEYQIVGDQAVPYSDRETVADYFLYSSS